MCAAVTGAAELCSVPAAAMDTGARGFRVPGQGWSAPGDVPLPRWSHRPSGERRAGVSVLPAGRVGEGLERANRGGFAAFPRGFAAAGGLPVGASSRAQNMFCFLPVSPETRAKVVNLKVD